MNNWLASFIGDVFVFQCKVRVLTLLDSFTALIGNS